MCQRKADARRVSKVRERSHDRELEAMDKMMAR